MGVQVTIAANQIDKERLGYHAISLTHFIDTAEPSIAAARKSRLVARSMSSLLTKQASAGRGSASVVLSISS